MTERAWYDNPTLDKRSRAITVLVLAISAPRVFSDFASQRSPWHIFVGVVWVLAALGVVASALLWWSRRSNTHAVTCVERIDPATVPTADVTRVIASTPTRISAIKQLREHFPGLRLGDAAHLIDSHLGPPPGLAQPDPTTT
ncbi:hypothetical protein CH282_16040 [Rhodococcus sp. 06-418-1B]|nr:hypothetical protein [Rhodococcus sp. 06-418-1B]OZC83460.1 hypothetical protein CH282_16040 [Rhodococcus sp. 06-418-1B]